MDRLEQATVNAEEAQRILTSPMFDKAFSDTRQAILEAIADLDNVRGEQAQDLHRMVKCLARVKRCLETHINTGKLAQKEIESRTRMFGLRRA